MINSSSLSINKINFFYKKLSGTSRTQIISANQLALEVSTEIMDSIIAQTDSKDAFVIEIFCEYTLSNGISYSAYNKFNIYSSKTSIGNTQVASDLVSTMPKIKDDMSSAQLNDVVSVLDKLSSLSSLNSSATNTTSTATSTATSTPTNSNSGNNKSKTEIVSPVCSENSCNKRGSCVPLLKTIACKCGDKFRGANCEFTLEDAELIKNVTNMLFDNLNKKILSSLGNNSTAINSELINLVDKQIENSVKVMEKMEDIANIKNMLNNILDTTNGKDDALYERIKNNSEVLVNSLNSLFKFTTLQIGKTKLTNSENAQRLNSQRMSLNNYDIEAENSKEKTFYVDKNDYDKYLNLNHEHLEGVKVINNYNRKKANNLRILQSTNSTTNLSLIHI